MKPLVSFRWLPTVLCAVVAISSSVTSGQQASPPQENPPVQQTQKPEQTGPQSSEPSAPSSEASGTQKEAPSSAPPPASATPPAEQEKSEAQKPAPSNSKKSKPVARKTASKKRKPAAGAVGSSTDGKVVVRNGGAKDSSTQLTPGMTQEQQAHSRENTAQLLATTDSNLKTIAGRQLTDSQQSMLDQIHTYVRQSKAAAESGDLPRAHTLAYKAHLLSDELARK
jgi:hypothetical protein